LGLGTYPLHFNCHGLLASFAIDDCRPPINRNARAPDPLRGLGTAIDGSILNRAEPGPTRELTNSREAHSLRNARRLTS
jgi:hypothetical protein